MAGCSDDPLRAHRPQQAPVPSTAWTGILAGLSYGYGFIGVDEAGFGPHVPAVAADGEGNVLRFHVAYAYVPEGQQPRIQFDDESASLQDPIRDVLRRGVLWPQDMRFDVTHARLDRLATEEWGEVQAVLAAGARAAREPRESRDCCVADGGSRLLHVAGESVQLDDNHDRGGGWGLVEDQMRLLRDWGSGEGSPA